MTALFIIGLCIVSFIDGYLTGVLLENEDEL